MNARQEAKLGMYNGILTLCNTNMSTVQKIKAFETAYISLNTIVTSIRAADQLLLNKSTGAENKKQARNMLVEMSAMVSGAVFAYATANNKDDLEKSAKITRTELRNLKDEELENACKNLLQMVNDHLAALDQYGINGTVVSELQNALLSYVQEVPTPAQVRAQKQVATKNLRIYFKQADELVKNQMDQLVTLLHKSDPEFVSQFRTLREITDPNTTTTQLTVLVTDLQLQPLRATVELGDSLKQDCDIDGAALFKPIEKGMYTILVSCPGYRHEIVSDVVVKLGTRQKLRVLLSKIEAAVPQA